MPPKHRTLFSNNQVTGRSCRHDVSKPPRNICFSPLAELAADLLADVFASAFAAGPLLPPSKPPRNHFFSPLAELAADLLADVFASLLSPLADAFAFPFAFAFAAGPLLADALPV